MGYTRISTLASPLFLRQFGLVERAGLSLELTPQKNRIQA